MSLIGIVVPRILTLTLLSSRFCTSISPFYFHDLSLLWPKMYRVCPTPWCK